MVATSTKPELNTSFGLKCGSPKATEKKVAKREDGASMCDSGREASPKAGLVGVGSDIPSEHEIHAQNAESAGSYISRAFSREKPCFRSSGGGALATVQTNGAPALSGLRGARRKAPALASPNRHGIARPHRWQKLLDEGKFESVSDLARQIGLDVSFAARLLRLTRLAPDIIEAILTGEEPSGLSLTMLTKQLSVVWEEQRREPGVH